MTKKKQSAVRKSSATVNIAVPAKHQREIKELIKKLTTQPKPIDRIKATVDEGNLGYAWDMARELKEEMKPLIRQYNYLEDLIIKNMNDKDDKFVCSQLAKIEKLLEYLNCITD